MTIEEAIAMFTFFGCNVACSKDMRIASRMAVKAFEEVEQYKDLGTVEELKEAKEKQIPKKPIKDKMKRIQCVNGHNQPTQHYKYCPMCGQLIDWSEG